MHALSFESLKQQHYFISSCRHLHLHCLLYLRNPWTLQCQGPVEKEAFTQWTDGWYFRAGQQLGAVSKKEGLMANGRQRQAERLLIGLRFSNRWMDAGALVFSLDSKILKLGSPTMSPLIFSIHMQKEFCYVKHHNQIMWGCVPPVETYIF